MSKKKFYKWTLEISVHKDMVEDGFDIYEDGDMINILQAAYPLADGAYFKAKIIEKPDAKEIRQLQGYVN